MAPVLLPVNLCRPPQAERLRARVLGKSGSGSEDGSESDGSDGSRSDAGSADNEYAEGLGFADRRDRGTPSGFEFDHHPREEYFEEPASWEGEARIFEQPVSRAGGAVASSVVPGLRDLEVIEAAAERAEERAAKRRRRTRGQPARAVPVPGSDVASATRAPAPPGALHGYCACLSLLRHHFDENSAPKSKPAAAGAAASDRVAEAVEILRALQKLEVGVAELGATKIGRELAKPTWRQHRSREVARLSESLLKQWRRTAGLQRAGGDSGATAAQNAGA
ncbi:unnamed protein product [Effrenium voratum]|nr:unnamed protein product [Effrenium voratum]